VLQCHESSSSHLKTGSVCRLQNEKFLDEVLAVGRHVVRNAVFAVQHAISQLLQTDQQRGPRVPTHSQLLFNHTPSYLELLPPRWADNQRRTSMDKWAITCFTYLLTGRMPFRLPNQQRQSRLMKATQSIYSSHRKSPNGSHGFLVQQSYPEGKRRHPLCQLSKAITQQTTIW